MKTGKSPGKGKWLAALAVSGTLMLGGLQADQEVTFELLDDLPEEGAHYIRAEDVSADGSVIVGRYYIETPETSSGNTAYLWRWENGILSKVEGSLGVDQQTSSLSPDGNILLAKTTINYQTKIIEWDFSSSASGIRTELPMTGAFDRVGCISDNNLVYAGIFNDELSMWNDGEIMPLGLLDGHNEGWATDVSADGSIIVGVSWYWDDANSTAVDSTPVRWVNGEIEALPKFPGYEALNHSPKRVSSDGSMVLGIIGTWPIESEGRIALWENGVPESLQQYPALGELQWLNWVRKEYVSRDLKTIIWSIYTNPGYQSFYLRLGTGWNPILLDDLLDAHGIDRQGYSGYDAKAISADGSTIIGHAYKEIAEGEYEVWPFRIRILKSESSFYGPFEILTNGYCDTSPWMGWLYVENDPWVWSVDMNHWLYCPGQDVTESGAWIYIPK